MREPTPHVVHVAMTVIAYDDEDAQREARNACRLLNRVPDMGGVHLEGPVLAGGGAEGGGNG